MTHDDILKVAMGYQASRVLLTGVELGVFTVIGDGETTSADVAAALHTDPRATDRLLNALSALGFLTKQDGRVRNSAAARQFLVRTSPGYMAGLGHTSSMWRTWSGLSDSVRTGQPAMGNVINDRGGDWLEPFIAAMHYRAARQADPIVGVLDLSHVERVLDVGGGSGAFAMAFARREPGLRAVVFDLPNVLPLTRRYIEEAGFSSRVTTVVGDFNTDPLPGGFDLIFLSAIVHGNSAKENAALIGKCAAALNPGGRVAIVDWVMDDERVQPTTGAMFALNMLVGTGAGDTFTESEIRGWFVGADLTTVARQSTPFGTDIMTATKE